MSENESDVQRERATDDRDNVVLTGEEIELPGDGSDAAAIIGETSEPINTGEIESVAIGGLTGRVPGAAPLKPAIEDKISTGELPVVPAPAVEFADEADSDLAFEDQLEDASFDAPRWMDSPSRRPHSPTISRSTMRTRSLRGWMCPPPRHRSSRNLSRRNPCTPPS